VSIVERIQQFREQELDEVTRSARTAAEALIALGKGKDVDSNMKTVQEFLQFANKSTIGAFLAFYQKMV